MYKWIYRKMGGTGLSIFSAERFQWTSLYNSEVSIFAALIHLFNTFLDIRLLVPFDIGMRNKHFPLIATIAVLAVITPASGSGLLPTDLPWPVRC